MMGNLLWIAIAYVMGSIPFGLVFARTFCGVDPRTGGSRNVGATNVARLCGTKWGVATLVCDALKGALPVAIALSFSDSTLFHSLTALAALLGHLHSCFLSFKGGKAVATTVGVFIPLAFWQLVLAGIACLLVIWRSGFVSLGSLRQVEAAAAGAGGHGPGVLEPPREHRAAGARRGKALAEEAPRRGGQRLRPRSGRPG